MPPLTCTVTAKEELTGKHVEAAIKDQIFTTQLARFLRHGNVQNRELVYRPPKSLKGEQNLRYLSLSTSTMVDQAGQQVAILCIARDITDSKKAEEAVFESEERYRSSLSRHRREYTLQM